MLALHYTVVLPADYDMKIIRERIAARGHLFADMDGLVFKQFLLADTQTGAPANLYAPVYLWSSAAAAGLFIGGPLFAGLCAAFGRPLVQTGFILDSPRSSALEQATLAHRTIDAPPPAANLPVSVQGGLAAGGTYAWLDPHGWSRTTMRYDGSPSGAGVTEAFEVALLARGAAWSSLA